MNSLEIFCRQIRSRSKDHAKAIALLSGDALSAQVVAILRQELDSMIRVMYLLSIDDRSYRNELIAASVQGRPWTVQGSNRRITDREMVDLANGLKHWARSVYGFGCAFIHLSSFHDYRERDPLTLISREEREAILQHMRMYHHGPDPHNETFNGLIPFLPSVFKKITENLECYLKTLEAEGDLLSL